MDTRRIIERERREGKGGRSCYGPASRSGKGRARKRIGRLLTQVGERLVVSGVLQEMLNQSRQTSATFNIYLQHPPARRQWTSPCRLTSSPSASSLPSPLQLLPLPSSLLQPQLGKFGQNNHTLSSQQTCSRVITFKSNC